MNKFFGILLWMFCLGAASVRIKEKDGSTTWLSGWSNGKHIWKMFVALVWTIVYSYIMKLFT